ncbi:MAG: DUF3857 domain-containing protein [Reichenbachiella sp.]|uniref:DUF3857 domain-containing protein n=1 Tax=Reichenbachiella sp. TaxID=2184521 RepID=UPI0032636493
MKKSSAIILFQFLLSLSVEGQNATISRQHVYYDFSANYHVRVTNKIILEVHNAKGAEFATYYDYQDKFKKIASFKMLIRNANGEVVKKYTSSDAYDLGFSESYEVDDSRKFVLRPEYKIYPYTAEIEVTNVYDGFIGFQPWIPQYFFGLAVRTSSLSIETPEGFEVNTFIEGDVKTDPNIEFRNGKIIKTWFVDNLDAIGNDISYKVFYKNAPKVLISPAKFSYDDKPGLFDSWASFGNWFNSLNLGRNELSEATKEKLDSYSISSTSERELIEWIYEYMQNRTRYVSIQLGIGGFQTLEAKFVDDNGYGDCKALTNYMKSMLNYVHIKSNFVLVKAGSDVPDLVSEFPSNQFNHVILGVPMKRDTIFLECTSQNQAFDYLGSFTDDRDVLWIEKDKSEIIHSPKYGIEINKKIIQGNAKIESSGEIDLNYTVMGTGSFYKEYRNLAHLSEGQILERSHEFFSYKDFSVLDLEFQKVSSNNLTYKANVTLSIRGLCKPITSRLLVPQNVMEPIESYVTYDRYKKFGEIKKSFNFLENIAMTFPDGYRMDEEPKSVELHSEIGDYKLQFKRIGTDTLEVKREFQFHKATYSLENFDKFYQFIKNIKTQERKVMVLRKTGSVK